MMKCTIFGSFKNHSFPRLQKQFKVFNIFWKTDLTDILIYKYSLFSNRKLFGRTSQFHCFPVEKLLWKRKLLNTANIKRKRKKKKKPKTKPKHSYVLTPSWHPKDTIWKIWTMSVDQRKYTCLLELSAVSD